MQRYSFKVDGEYRRPTPDDAGAFYDVAIVNARIAEAMADQWGQALEAVA